VTLIEIQTVMTTSSYITFGFDSVRWLLRVFVADVT